MSVLSSFLTSKSLWVNVIAIAGIAVQAKTGFIVSPDLQAGALAAINALLHGLNSSASSDALVDATTAAVAPIIVASLPTAPVTPRNGVNTANEVVAVADQIIDSTKAAQ